MRTGSYPPDSNEYEKYISFTRFRDLKGNIFSFFPKLFLSNNRYIIRGFIDMGKIVVNLGANMDLIYFSTSLMGGGDGVKEVEEEYRYFSQLQTSEY